MQPLRGTKDILPNEIIFWQHIYNEASRILSLSNYYEIRTPIIETTALFKRSIGNGTDIVNKEMYSFIDQGAREICLRPEGTASIARAFISNKLYINNNIQRLWYLAPMFRYERPQHGRQRQFHQLGIECIGSINPMADTEVIRLAEHFIKSLKCINYTLEINSIGNLAERNEYKKELIEYLSKYQKDLDIDSLKKLKNNPLKILDSKNKKTQEILVQGPCLNNYLKKESKKHFHTVCEYLNELEIAYNINYNLVRGLDYYNYTAFEIKTDLLGSQDTICGGGRYDSLIQQLGGPDTPAVGWAIGLERLLLLIEKNLKIQNSNPIIYLATYGEISQKYIWPIIKILENEQVKFELNLSNNSFQKQLKKADKSGAIICLIIGENECINNNITIKWLETGLQETVKKEYLLKIIKNL